MKVTVKPGSKRFSVHWDGSVDGLRVELTERAEKNKANAELLKKLSKLFGARVSLVRGAGSRRKVLRVELDEQEVRERVKQAA